MHYKNKGVAIFCIYRINPSVISFILIEESAWESQICDTDGGYMHMSCNSQTLTFCLQLNLAYVCKLKSRIFYKLNRVVDVY